MHVADQLFVEAFDVQIEGEQASHESVFPDWSLLDRFGIVVTEPLGGLGASLLLQLAIAEFYAVRASTPVNPEIYLFHVGRPHGDFSNFDFWPPRKEVRVAAAQPVSLLEAINAHGITRLAIPISDIGPESVLRTGPSTWAEQASAAERLRSCFVYSSEGRVIDGELRISSSDPRVRENITASLDPLPGAISLREELESDTPPPLPGFSVAADVHRWADLVEHRAGEVAPSFAITWPKPSPRGSSLTNSLRCTTGSLRRRPWATSLVGSEGIASLANAARGQRASEPTTAGSLSWKHLSGGSQSLSPTKQASR